jgi:hypothetical protein
MNPIIKLINFQRSWFTPAFFGSILGGLFGKDQPDAPSLESMIAKGNNTNGLLFNTGYSFDPNTKQGQGNVSLTGKGQGIAKDYSRMFEDAQQNYNEFGIPEYADERYGLMRDIMNRDDVMGMNRLMATQNAQGGGVGVTAGQRDTSSRFGAEQGFNRQRAILGLLNQGEQRENTLFGRIAPALNNYTNFMQGGSGQLNNDMMQYNNMSKQVGAQRQGQYQSDMQDYADSMSFWNDIGGFGDSFVGGQIGGLFGGGGQAGLSASGNAFSGISGYNSASPFAQAYPQQSTFGGAGSTLWGGING